MAYQNKRLIEILKKNIPKTSFVNGIKIIYRPYICPFGELLSNIKENKSIFDIGCGSGMFLLLVTKLRKPKKLAGIEIDDKLVKNAQFLLQETHIENIIETYDGVSIPESIIDYDYVTMIDVLHHIPKKQQFIFLEKVYGNMSKGRVLILKDINASKKIWTIFNKLHDLLLAGEIGNEISLEQAIKWLEEIGFEIISKSTKQTLVYPHYIIIARKV